MSINPLNMGSITGGLTADPEVKGNLARLRLAVDYAGREQGSDNRSGYFDITYFLNDDSPNGKFVAGQIRDGKMKKGSKITVAFSLQHERWTAEDGSKRSTVVLLADAITYTPTSRAREDGAADGNGKATTAPAAANASAAPVEF